MKKNIVNLAENLMAKSEVVTLASVNENGFPRICAMANVKSEGIKTIWMATGTHSRKTAHFLKNPKASVCTYSGGDSLTLVGNISVISDKEIKHDLWQDWFIEHFPKGEDDPEYCVLKFEAKEATIYIDEIFETVSV
ncbi:pyridoxamine 5'-phosphate oxidase family protein [Dethiosulfovibrio sp. F2B]|uniref:pyridoxamine 5'-phosphate oxidase family protein n=1 Tax=Dethiosulfovibrio faecalis TaxID=2720018 RepID=UPI001F18162A|nr:pyridoxamine 5'-phosphate oxidase family protein [Dethiosulfovibrio faecalis]MCF4151056.1 pyridoxamine 5'-phosphate oxidase family protein [Dethiosulfovibrio faecalis]